MPRILNFARNGKDAATKEIVPSLETPPHPIKDEAEEEAAMIGKYLRLADRALASDNGKADDAQKLEPDKEAA